jgi:hypothetical protein
MENFILHFVLLLAGMLPVIAQVSVNNDCSIPDASAMFDIKSTNKERSSVDLFRSFQYKVIGSAGGDIQ